MAVSIIETIKSRANASNTAYIAVVKLLCDDYSDLPAQSGLSGYELAQGCIAHVINENKDYMIDSNGNWHVYGGDSWTNVYTKSETDALLDDKQDELTTAQLAAVNSGITAAKLTEMTAKEEQLENNKLSMAQAYGYDVGYALLGTVDLNNLTTVGVYYYTAAAGTTITHAPTSSPFRLEVIQSAGAARYCQFMFANAENSLYFRNLVGSTWTGWYKIDATAV